MTLSSTTRKWTYTGDGATDTYAYTTRIVDDDHLQVTRTDLAGAETTLTKTTDYTVSGVGDDTGGNVTLVAGDLTSGFGLVIEIVVPLTQTTDIRNQGSFFPETHEEQMDLHTRADQQQQDEIDRSVKLPTSLTTSDFDPVLPDDIDGTASVAPITNSAGDGWADADTWPSATDISNAAANAAAAAASAAAAATSAGINDPMSLVNVGLATSQAAGAMTVSLKGADGSTDPGSGTDSVTIYFQDDTAADGTVTARTVTSALSIVIPSGATLGHNDAIAERVHVWAIDNSGTVELAVSGGTAFHEYNNWDTTTIDATSDDAAVLYSTTGRTSKPIRLIGTISVNNTTAGTWASAPTRIFMGPFYTWGKAFPTISRTASFNAKYGSAYAVNTTSGAITATLPTPRAGRKIIFFDKENTWNTNNFTIARNGSEDIDGVAANKTYEVNGGRVEIISEGTNWFTFGSSPSTAEDKTSVTVFTGPTTSSTTVPTTIASPTLSAAEYSVGTAVTRATNTLTFPFTGIYKITFQFGNMNESSGVSEVGVRLRNTTDNTTSDAGVAGVADDSADTCQTIILFGDITDTAKNYEIQWEAQNAGVTVVASTVLTEATPQWRIVIERMGDT